MSVRRRGEPQRRRPLLAAGALLAGLLLLVGAAGLMVVDPAPSLADAGVGLESAMVAPPAHALSPGQEMTPTVFLPLVVGLPPAPLPPNAWQGAYYTNMSLDGQPLYITEDEARIDFDWGDDGAPPGLPDDHFSVRWIGDWEFEAGYYTFFLYADDGVRLSLDGELLIDAWLPGIGSHSKRVLVETEGLHRVQLDYFEQEGGAAVRLHWRRTDLYPQWHGDYYYQPWVESGWQFERTDSVVQFDWGLGAPEGLPPDAFSVAWTQHRLFEPGTHRIFLYADEGYQLYVDGGLKKEGGWYTADGGAVDVVYTLEAGGLEYHDLTFNFHDRGTLAEARIWSEYLEHPTWYIEFYDNPSLQDPPVIVDPDGEKIFFDWGLNKPRSAMPSADSFSIRWSGQRYFHAGFYRFGLFADDGVRLWVDGELLVDQWHAGRGEYHAPVTYLNGYHDVVLEYFEDSGEAEIRFWWE